MTENSLDEELEVFARHIDRRRPWEKPPHDPILAAFILASRSFERAMYGFAQVLGHKPQARHHLLLHLLYAIADAPEGRTQKDLAERTVVSPSALTAMLGKARDRGEIKGEKKKGMRENESPSVRWTIKKRGAKVLEDGMAEVYGSLDTLFQGFTTGTDGDFHRFLDLLRRFTSNAEQLRFDFGQRLENDRRQQATARPKRDRHAEGEELG